MKEMVPLEDQGLMGSREKTAGRQASGTSTFDFDFFGQLKCPKVQ
jgi:hypothetical protein